MNWSKLPKIELHIHLDCSLSYDLVKKLDPSISWHEYKSKFQAPINCNSLNEYIIKAEPAIDLMQSKESLHLSVLDLAEQFVKDQVVYAEIRFAPLEHCRKGLSDIEVVEIVEKAAEKAAEKYGIEIYVILCCLRHYEEGKSLRVAELTARFKGSRIVALDLAGDETLPSQPHEAAFKYAVVHGIHRTSHAGEACGSESVNQSIHLFQVERIGHGVRSWESEETMNLLLQRDIHLEVCPSSNLLTGIYPDIRNHAVDKLRNYGVSLGINTDGRTISNVNLSGEYQKLAETFGWKQEDFLRHNLEAIKHAFAPEKIKKSVRKRLFEGYGQ